MKMLNKSVKQKLGGHKNGVEIKSGSGGIRTGEAF